MRIHSYAKPPFMSKFRTCFTSDSIYDQYLEGSGVSDKYLKPSY